LKECDKWDALVYIPQITSERWKTFRAYFAFVLGHELEHVKIIQEKLDFHMCVSWLYDFNDNIFRKAGKDCKSMKQWNFPSELHCNKKGKKVTINLFGKEEFEKCFRDLIKSKEETDEHKEYLTFVVDELAGEPHKNKVCKSILDDIQKYYKYYKVPEKTAHEIYKEHKLQGLKCTKRFDLEKFLPVLNSKSS